MSAKTPLSPEHYREVPGAIDLIDIRHPERLDWRRARYLYDTRENRWQHFVSEPKAGGRSADDLAACPIMQAQIGDLLKQLFERIHPGWTQSISKIEEPLTCFEVEGKALCMSFHLNAKGMQILRGYSRHDELKFSGHWQELCQSGALLRKRQAA